MPLYVTIRISETSTISGKYSPEENHTIVTKIINGREIAEELWKCAIQNRRLSPILDMFDLGSKEKDFSAESTPWLSHLRIQGNSIEGLNSSNGTFSLSIEAPGVSEWFWSGPIESLIIGTRPYGV